MAREGSPLRAIKEKCLDCCCGSASEVSNCTCTQCPLYPFRKGKNTNLQGRKVSEEQKQAASERFKKMWEERKKSES